MHKKCLTYFLRLLGVLGNNFILFSAMNDLILQEVDEENLEEDNAEAISNSGPVLVSKSEHDLKTKLDNLFLNCPDRNPRGDRPRKRTLKSLNRLTVDGRPPMSNIPASPESPPQALSDSPPARFLTQARPSI